MISAALSAGGAQSTRIGIASTVIGVDSPSAPIGRQCARYFRRGLITECDEAPHLRALPSMQRCSYAKVIAASRPELPVWRVLLGRVAAGAADIRRAAHRYQVGHPWTAWFASPGR